MKAEDIVEKDQEQELKNKKSLLLDILGEENVNGENYYKSTPIVTNYYYYKE